ncbi:MAG: ATP-binding protein [Acetobacteraceae bacterium]|nr:ATP-binding protein [Acetobacteraceae bacterium]
MTQAAGPGRNGTPDGPAHDHGHRHADGHHHGARPGERGFGPAIAPNLGFVVLEATAGIIAGSVALLADAVGERIGVAVHREQRRPGVTLMLLWDEYRATTPGGYQYSRWCELCRAWEGRLFADPGLARGDGRHARLMRTLGAAKLLMLDDRGLEPLGPEQQRDLLEPVEDRYGRGAALITSQVPVDRWHDLIGNPTLADAILDRLVHNAHRIQLRGDSLRRKRPAKPVEA